MPFYKSKWYHLLKIGNKIGLEYPLDHLHLWHQVWGTPKTTLKFDNSPEELTGLAESYYTNDSI